MGASVSQNTALKQSRARRAVAYVEPIITVISKWKKKRQCMLRDRFPAPCSPLSIVFVVCLWGFCCCFVCLVCCCCFGGDVFFCFYLAFGKSEARRGWSVIHWLGWWGWGTCLNIALLSLVLVEGAMGVTYKGCSVPWLWRMPTHPPSPGLFLSSTHLIGYGPFTRLWMRNF